MKDYAAKAQQQIDYANSAIARWREGFDKDPAYALSWGNQVFEHAATAKVFAEVVAGVENLTKRDGEFGDKQVTLLCEYACARVMDRSASPPQSTSPTSNLMEQYELKAWARVYRMFNGDSFY